MYRFWEAFTEPLLRELAPRVIIEVGSFEGENTARLLNYCRDHQARLHAIDPLPRFDVAAWQAEYGSRFVMHTAKSLDALPTIEPADVALIDGDHNWYTVYHELKLVAQVADANNRAMPVVLFHDIGWPYARRDLYYNPDDIPAEFRHPYRVNGVVPGQSTLRRHGFNWNLANAVFDGGPRNGVLTAVEDFMAESDTPLTLLLISGFHGLGILYPNSLKETSPAMRAHLEWLERMTDQIGGFLQQIEDDRIQSLAAWLRLRRKFDKVRVGSTTEQPSETDDDGARGERRVAERNRG